MGILGNIPLSIFTIVISNIENSDDNSITILSVVTSMLTLILSISELVESRQIKYTYDCNENINSRTTEI